MCNNPENWITEHGDYLLVEMIEMPECCFVVFTQELKNFLGKQLHPKAESNIFRYSLWETCLYDFWIKYVSMVTTDLTL